MSGVIAHLSHAVLLLLVRHLPSGNVGFQTFVEVTYAGDRIGDGEYDEEDCDNRYYKSVVVLDAQKSK